MASKEMLQQKKQGLRHILIVVAASCRSTNVMRLLDVSVLRDEFRQLRRTDDISLGDSWIQLGDLRPRSSHPRRDSDNRERNSACPR